LAKPVGGSGVENHVLRDVAFVPQSSMTTAAPFVRLLAVRHLALLSTVCSLKPCPALEIPRRLKSKEGRRAQFDIHLRIDGQGKENRDRDITSKHIEQDE
jgi:hypothetical protein